MCGIICFILLRWNHSGEIDYLFADTMEIYLFVFLFRTQKDFSAPILFIENEPCKRE